MMMTNVYTWKKFRSYTLIDENGGPTIR